MAKQHPIELFMPPNILKAKVGGGKGATLDLAAFKRAEAAMESLKAEFFDWLTQDIQNLEKLRDEFAATRSQEARDGLFRACHDMKGQAATFEYPMIGRLAASLCKLIDETKSLDALPTVLVEAHVAAIRVLYRDKIQDSKDAIAVTLCTELEARTAETLAAV